MINSLAVFILDSCWVMATTGIRTRAATRLAFGFGGRSDLLIALLQFGVAEDPAKHGLYGFGDLLTHDLVETSAGEALPIQILDGEAAHQDDRASAPAAGGVGVFGFGCHAVTP